MRTTWLLAPLLLCATLPALADGAPGQVAAGAQASAAARLGQQLRAHGAQVSQLQQALSEQESHSRQAAERLARQDLEIARLQHQLDALRDRRQAGGPGQ